MAVRRLVGGRGDREQSRQQCLRLSEPERTLGRPVKPHRLRADHELEHPEKRSAGWGGGQSEYRPAGRGGQETDFSAGINALWHRVELGYIYAHNKIDQFNMAGVTSECDGDCAIGAGAL